MKGCDSAYPWGAVFIAIHGSSSEMEGGGVREEEREGVREEEREVGVRG